MGGPDRPIGCQTRGVVRSGRVRGAAGWAGALLAAAVAVPAAFPVVAPGGAVVAVPAAFPVVAPGGAVAVPAAFPVVAPGGAVAVPAAFPPAPAVDVLPPAGPAPGGDPA